jgi:predicted molibdopterin-dependent oxidoreductase YjgC
VGCQLELEIKNNRIMQSTPDPDGPSNHGQSCVKGHFGIAEFVHSPDRLTTPLIRKNGEFAEATWDEALDYIADGLKKYRPQETAVISSARCTNEENYLLQKFGGQCWGRTTWITAPAYDMPLRWPVWPPLSVPGQ